MPPKQHTTLSTTGVAAVTEALRGEGIRHEVIEHDEALTAAEEAAATGSPQHRVAKTIVLHDDGVYMLAVVPASHRIDLHKLREAVGVQRSLHLASEAQLARDFPDLEVGAVPPVGPLVPSREVVDQRLLEEDRVVCAGGDHQHSIVLDPRDIVAAMHATVADICED